MENATAPVGVEALIVDVLAIAAAAAWLLVFGWCSVVTSASPAGGHRGSRAGAGAGEALVNLSVTRCRLNGAAYPATILDLAADGYLTISERVPGRLWCHVPATSPPGTGLARSERLVLAGAGALAGGRGAPFEALAESCASDVRGRWDPFSGRCGPREDGPGSPGRGCRRRRGCCSTWRGSRRRGGLRRRVRQGPLGLWAPTVTAFFAFAVLAYWARWVGGRTG